MKKPEILIFLLLLACLCTVNTCGLLTKQRTRDLNRFPDLGCCKPKCVLKICLRVVSTLQGRKGAVQLVRMFLLGKKISSLGALKLVASDKHALANATLVLTVGRPALTGQHADSRRRR